MVAGLCLRKNTSWLVVDPSSITTRRCRNAATESTRGQRSVVEVTSQCYHHVLMLSRDTSFSAMTLLKPTSTSGDDRPCSLIVRLAQSWIFSSSTVTHMHIHSLTNCLMLTHQLTHISLVHSHPSLTHPLTHIHEYTNSLISFTVTSSTHTLTQYPLTLSFTHSLTHSLISTHSNHFSH